MDIRDRSPLNGEEIIATFYKRELPKTKKDKKYLNLPNLKSEVNKIHADKIKTVPGGLSKLSNVADNVAKYIYIAI